MAKTISELRNQSIQVRDASAAGENTATRVGTVLNDIVGHIEDYENTQSSNNSSQDAKIEGVKSSLNAEIARAKTEESNLSNQIGTERTERQAAVSREETVRIQADNDEKTAREKADNAEQDARIKADNDEKTARENADITLRTMIQTEVSNRQIAVKQEEIRAMAAEKANAQAIADETARATTEEERLQGKIDNTNTNVETLENKVNSNHDHLTDEVARLDLTDNEIKADLEAESVRATAAEKANADNIAKNAQAITDEVARAKAAEEAIIFDVSALNGGVVFESLQVLLSSSDLSTLIPASVRHGGMTIRFIQGFEQSSDNKYVQYRYMGTEITGTPNPFLDTTNWQGVDDEPIAGSDNLVKSGGIANKISEVEEITDTIKNRTDSIVKDIINNYFFNRDDLNYGSIQASGLVATSDSRLVTDYINVNPKGYIIIPNTLMFDGEQLEVKIRVVGFEKEELLSLGSIDRTNNWVTGRKVEIPDNCNFVRVSFGIIKDAQYITEPELLEKYLDGTFYIKHNKPVEDCYNIKEINDNVNSLSEKIDNTNESIQTLRDEVEGVHSYISTSDKSLEIDAEGHVLGSIDREGVRHDYLEKINHEKTSFKKGVNICGTSVSEHVHPFAISVDTDENGNIHHYIKNNGIHAFPSGIESPTIDAINKAIEEGGGSKSGIFKYNDKKKYDELIRQMNFTTNVSGAKVGVPLSIGYFSDIHYDLDNVKNITEFFANYKNEFSDVICGGDVIEYYWTDSFNNINEFNAIEGANKILLTVGNHDAWQDSFHTMASKTDVYNRLFAAIGNWNVTSPAEASISGLLYYYKDYNKGTSVVNEAIGSTEIAGIRLIVLDCMYWSDNQETWLENTLTDALTKKLAIVISTHYQPDEIVPLECPFSTLANYKWITLNSAASLKVQNFIDNGGEFICWLAGHTHLDMVGSLKNYPKQLCLVIATASCSHWQTDYTDQSRIKGTKSQDAFDILSFDTAYHIVKIARVGADIDGWNRKKDFVSINYKKMSINN